jgi:TonB family protein
MFDCIRHENTLTSSACAASLVVSLIVHTAVIAMLILVPLFLMGQLPQEKLLTLLFTPRKLSIPEFPSPPVASISTPSGQQVRKASGFKAEIPAEAWVQPLKIPDILPPPEDELPVFAGTGFFQGDGKGKTGYSRGIDDAINGLLPEKVVEILPVPKPPKKTIPIRVGVLEPSRLIYKVDPVYPELAKRVHLSGDVHLEAFIDEEGNVTEVKILDGNQLFCDAAVEAVRQWKYTPTVHNGEPIPILVSIKISFRIR